MLHPEIQRIQIVDARGCLKITGGIGTPAIIAGLDNIEILTHHARGFVVYRHGVIADVVGARVFGKRNFPQRVAHQIGKCGDACIGRSDGGVVLLRIG